METINATEARGRLFEILKSTVQKNKQFRIPYKEGNALLLAEEEYESLMETLFLLSSPGFKKAYRKSKKEIQEGRVVTFEKVFK